jgi:hypothetical protein
MSCLEKTWYHRETTWSQTTIETMKETIEGKNKN